MMAQPTQDDIKYNTKVKIREWSPDSSYPTPQWVQGATGRVIDRDGSLYTVALDDREREGSVYYMAFLSEMEVIENANA